MSIEVVEIDSVGAPEDAPSDSDVPSDEATFVQRIFGAMNVRQEILLRHPAPPSLAELIQYTERINSAETKALAEPDQGYMYFPPQEVVKAADSLERAMQNRH